MNGYGASADDNEGDSSDDVNGPNNNASGIVARGADGRSVSSTLHDRTSRATASGGTPALTIGAGTGGAARGQAASSASRRPGSSQSQHQHHHHQHRHEGLGGAGGGGSSPPSARETFLNYFFGQNGPGPMPGAGGLASGMGSERSHNPTLGMGSSSHHHRGGGSGGMGMGVVPTGRDLFGSDTSVTSGIMAGKRGLDGSNAAYDMKSLGKHIEAVSLRSPQLLFVCFSFC